MLETLWCLYLGVDPLGRVAELCDVRTTARDPLGAVAWLLSQPSACAMSPSSCPRPVSPSFTDEAGIVLGSAWHFPGIFPPASGPWCQPQGQCLLESSCVWLCHRVLLHAAVHCLCWTRTIGTYPAQPRTPRGHWRNFTDLGFLLSGHSIKTRRAGSPVLSI